MRKEASQMNRKILTFVAVLLFCVQAANPAMCVRIMTFNAEWLVYTEDETDKDSGGPEYTLNEHYERVAGVIESLEPDVVNLVEVTTREGVDYLVDILHEKGLTDYKGYHIENKDPSTGQDVALVSRMEPEQVGGQRLRIFYSRHAGEKWREPYTWTTAGGVQKHGTTSVTKNVVYFFDVDGHKIGFLGLHLKAIPDNKKANAQREAQARVAAKIIREEIAAKGYVPIVLGDLNDYDSDVPDRDDTSSTLTDVLATIKNYDLTQPGNELVNAAGKISRVFDRYTSHYDKNHDGIPDENEPMTMIDHVLIHKSLMPDVDRVFIDHGHGSQTSDHWPVVVDLTLD
jgi:endonuclease/exonuclease/phosphatase family metal-dependent hydrolase